MTQDILNLIKTGETSSVQFKERILDKYDIGCEMVAFLLDTQTIDLVADLDTRLGHSDTDHDTKSGDHDTRPGHSDTRQKPLTKQQKDIINFCSVPRTSREILERAGVVYHTKNVSKYITSLVAAGYLQMTNPGNPTASNQKYKKTETLKYL